MGGEGVIDNVREVIGVKPPRILNIAGEVECHSTNLDFSHILQLGAEILGDNSKARFFTVATAKVRCQSTGCGECRQKCGMKGRLADCCMGCCEECCTVYCGQARGELVRGRAGCCAGKTDQPCAKCRVRGALGAWGTAFRTTFEESGRCGLAGGVGA